MKTKKKTARNATKDTKQDNYIFCRKEYTRQVLEEADWTNGLNGHFVFEPLFIEEYIQNKNVIKDAQYYASRSSTLRGKTGADMVFIKTCIIRKESTATWTCVVNGHNELAIVAEPKGLLTMNVFDVKNNRRYDSTVQVERGTSSRYVVFDTLGNAKIEVTIINTTKQDVGFCRHKQLIIRN